MSAMVVVGAVWMALALGLALMLGRAIRLADAKECRTSHQSNFVVDGDPFDAPLPAAPMSPTALLTGGLPLSRRPADGA
ncbi:hypothetical protein [Blastococcus saxobsidens]|uniref:Uncharacterized protein n=1 Tax=Blastococcus saxobsidens (strain DD2) TaxID=1146883 RepID=H6RN09_BLASD|nr:hypothetical protein [Blastococcus saxobsidens]CCG01362.1 exported protein of unknown function [Blastococcus saxobsidens DD2]